MNSAVTGSRNFVRGTIRLVVNTDGTIVSPGIVTLLKSSPDYTLSFSTVAPDNTSFKITANRVYTYNNFPLANALWFQYLLSSGADFINGTVVSNVPADKFVELNLGAGDPLMARTFYVDFEFIFP